MDATCNVQDSIHVFHLVHNMCPGFWVHIKILTTLSGFLLISQVSLGSSLPWQLALFWRRSVGQLGLVGR